MLALETGVRRFWTYQQERFPILAHGPLILAFSLCAVCFSSLLRGAERFPAWPVIAVAFVSSFFSFLHLRLADEFKISRKIPAIGPTGPSLVAWSRSASWVFSGC